MSTPASRFAQPTRSAPRTETVIDRLVGSNRAYAAGFVDPGMGARPVLRVAGVACLGARVDLHAAPRLELGDRHTLRNAGGVGTDDPTPSPALIQAGPRPRRV